jgi:hypothetical protein
MSGRTLQQGLSRTPSRLLLISSPFLLVRFVVFCQYEKNSADHLLTLQAGLLIYMSLTALVFAAWNVGASRAAGANGECSSIRVTFPGF